MPSASPDLLATLGEKRGHLSLLLEVLKAVYFSKAVEVLKTSNVGKVNSKFQCVKGMLTINK